MWMHIHQSDKKAILEEKEKESDHNAKCYDVWRQLKLILAQWCLEEVKGVKW